MKFEEFVNKIADDSLQIDDTAEFNYWIGYHRVTKIGKRKYKWYFYEGGWSTTKEWFSKTVLKQLAKMKPENIRSFTISNTTGMIFIDR